MAAPAVEVAPGLLAPWQVPPAAATPPPPGFAASADWLEPYQAGFWAQALPALGAAYVPALLALAGVAVGLAVPLLLHFHHPELPTIRGIEPLAQLLAVGGLTFALVAGVALLGLHTGAGGGLGGATGGLEPARETAEKVASLAFALNASCVLLTREVDRLAHACPQQMQKILGGSMEEAKGRIDMFADSVANFLGVVSHLPEQLGQVASSGRSVGETMGSYLFVSTAAAAFAAGSVVAAIADVQVGGSALMHAMGHYGDFDLPALGVFGGLGATAVALSAAAELHLGARTGATCGDVDESTLRYAGDHFGFNSSSYAMAAFYITGRGQNPALAALDVAKASLEASDKWVKQYQWAIQKACPEWNPQELAAALDSVGGQVRDGEALLAPRTVYQFYRSAVHGSMCDTAIPNLAWLVFLQVPLAFLCLPAVAVLGSIFLRTVTEGRQFSRLGQEERESDGDHEKDFNPLYYVVYAFSVVAFVVGAAMYFLPSTSISRRIVGTLLYGTGIFLLSNSDLIVTYVRMRYQMDRMRKNNETLQESLTEQASTLRDLSKAAQALATIQKRFGGDVKRAMKEVDRLSDVVRSDVKMACKSLLRLYSDKDANRLIIGPELNDTFELMQLVFGGVFRKDYAQRAAALRQAIEAHPRTRDRGVSEAAFSEVQAMALVEGDIRRIPEQANRILDMAKLSK